MNVTHITSSAAVQALANGMLDPHRDRPWAVITLPVDLDQPLVDIPYLHDQIGDVCTLHVIKTGSLTRELDALLPERCQVYGGASRVYPTGTGWQTRPEDAPLRFVHNPKNSEAVAEQLISDALGMAAAAGLFAKPTTASVRQAGTVRSLIAGNTRAIVALDNGDYATIVHELTFPDIPLEWIIREGQHLEGDYDPHTKRLTPDLSRFRPEQLLEHYPNGTVTLAYVVSVERQSAMLAVHPSVPITVAKRDITSNPLDRVDLLLAPGDVVHARVIRDEQGRTALRLSDVDDDETIEPAQTLTRGAQPWLIQNRHKPQPQDDPALDELEHQAVPEYAHEEPHPTAPKSPTEATAPEHHTPPRPGPGPRRVGAATTDTNATTAATASPATPERPASALQSTQLALQKERAENIQLKIHLKRLTATNPAHELELAQVLAQNRRLREDLRTTRADQQAQRAMLRKTMQATATSNYDSRRARFDTDDAWVRHEIYLAWIDRYDSLDRSAWPLPGDYIVGARLAESLDNFDDASTNKAFKAIVDAVTGRARELPARSPHPLRRGDGSAAEDLVRDDGARCMRIHIEKNVPSARRLHYWVHEGGQIELSRVVLHDDMEP